jgi:hypothetical protein
MGVMFDIIGSILVRTAIVLIVLRMNISLNTMVSETVAHSTIQQELSILREVMTFDFEYAGLGVAAGTAVKECSPGKFKFEGDLEADGSIEAITYSYGATSELANTINPNDRKLYRQVGGETVLNIANGITKCVFTYYNASGVQTTDKTQVKMFSISLILQDGSLRVESWKDGVQIITYPTSYWEQSFFPSNL